MLSSTRLDLSLWRAELALRKDVLAASRALLLRILPGSSVIQKSCVLGNSIDAKSPSHSSTKAEPSGEIPAKSRYREVGPVACRSFP